MGTTRNAVEIQLWTALTTILILAYLRAIAKYPWHLSNLVHSLRLNTFTKIDLQGWLDDPFSPPKDDESLDMGYPLFRYRQSIFYKIIGKIFWTLLEVTIKNM